MTPRTRRWLAAALGVVALLFVGRWLAAWFTLRWWSAAISPDAHAAVARWQLLGLGLDLAAIIVASLWFTLQGWLVARAIGTVQVERRFGDAVVREVVPPQRLLLGAALLGLLLGTLTGAGARNWRAPFALSRQTAVLGIDDPLLGVDVGDLVTKVPIRHELLGYWLALVLIGLALTLLLYLMIGAIRRHDGELRIHADARRHLGGLLAILAASIGVWYLLAPYRLATSIDVPLGLAGASIRVLAANAATGATIAVVAMSIAWALRGRHSLLVSGWLVLGCVVLVERLLLPAFIAEGQAPERDAQARTFDRVMHQITITEGVASADSVPAVTRVVEEQQLRGWTAARAARMHFATPDSRETGATWLMAWRPDVHEASGEIVAVADDRVAPGGLPRLVGSEARFPRGFATAPGLSGWAQSPTGVRVGGLLRRAALAWTLQAPAILGLPEDAVIDWDRDPAARAAALMPGIEWSTDDLVMIGARWMWVVTGRVAIERAPLSSRVSLDGRTVSGVVMALVALVGVDDGTVTVYRDPSHHPVGDAWAAVHRALAGEREDRALPVEVGYPSALFTTQLDVLSRPHWNVGVRPLGPAEDSLHPPLPVRGSRPGEWQAMMEDPSHGRSVTLVVASRREGQPLVTVHRLPDPAMPALRELTAAWLRMPTPTQLRDSLRAAGDSLVPGSVHWHVGAGGPVAWQAFRSAGLSGATALLWVGTSWPAGVGGDRSPTTAWRGWSLTSADSGGRPGEEFGALQAVRTWMARADSALTRGDLTAFGRAWEALRALLLENAPRRGLGAAP